ncbi:hypothetical protein IFM89_012960 [Coptis chinensis]|uniref:Uncharacterized protein n=1 Tax=Coptis chinensis TaxID=261450 RepID=A0A835LVP8_9MAGN|nr:hypothetical protein IFM89_012960 [Coptis chinensis]
MDQCGEGQAALRLLEEKLVLAQEEQKENDARNVHLIMVQIKYLQKNVDEALSSYEELAKEDPNDYRPYFYQKSRGKEGGMYSKDQKLLTNGEPSGEVVPSTSGHGESMVRNQSKVLLILGDIIDAGARKVARPGNK